MNKKILLFFIVSAVFTATPKEKYVIGCERCGFFSIFFGVLNHLAWCEKNNKIPVVYWGPRCLYYQPEGYNGSQNAWDIILNRFQTILIIAKNYTIDISLQTIILLNID